MGIQAFGRRVFLVFPLLVIAALPARAAATPSQVVTSFHETLLGVMKEATTLGIRGRYDKLAPRIEQSFHLPLMIQVAASSYWRKADPAQTEKLIRAFTRLSVSTYATQFDSYGGQSFETQGEQPGPQNTTLVKTRIVDPGSDPVEITYVTRKIKGAWRIIDVLVDKGISELAVRRSEYRGILRSGGIDGLIRTLNAKADQLLSE